MKRLQFKKTNNEPFQSHRERPVDYLHMSAPWRWTEHRSYYYSNSNENVDRMYTSAPWTETEFQDHGQHTVMKVGSVALQCPNSVMSLLKGTIIYLLFSLPVSLT